MIDGKRGRNGEGIQKYTSVVAPMRKFIDGNSFAALTFELSGDMTIPEKRDRDLGNVGARIA